MAGDTYDGGDELFVSENGGAAAVRVFDVAPVLNSGNPTPAASDDGESESADTADHGAENTPFARVVKLASRAGPHGTRCRRRGQVSPQPGARRLPKV